MRTVIARKLTSARARRRSAGAHGQETMVSDLTYDLRSGEPDAIDQLVAITFANIAVELIRDGVSGRMVGIQSGHYGHVPLPDAAVGRARWTSQRFTTRIATGQLRLEARRAASVWRF